MAKKTVMLNNMVDNETMGTVPDSVILSIGVAKFDKYTPDVIGETFYAVLDIDEQIARGRIVDPETIKWWGQQSEQARIVLTTKEREPVEDVLSRLWVFLGGYFNDDLVAKPGNEFFWGNGSDFDNPQIASLFHMYGFELPWKFWNNRCFRTMKSEFGYLAKAPVRVGTYHNALDDAITQIKHLHLIQTALTEKLNGGK